MKKRIFKVFTALFMVAIILGGVILIQNDFKIVEKSVDIKTSKGILKGTLVLPQKLSDKAGLVVFIHGDGPADASYNEQYKPLWEELAKQGYASLSWSKPGISGSEGNWLLQSMDDRASEANEVIEWAKTLPEIDNNRIGLWGASQAGWVIPKIVQLNKNIAFNILVAPAINWIEQGKYNTLKELEKKGATKDEMIKKEKEFENELELLKKDVSYEEYVKEVGQKEAVSEDRRTFIKKNYKADATEDIKHFYSPVKLFLGGKDINVDSENTKEVYEKEVPSEILKVTLIPTTDHFMLKASLVDSKIKTFFVGLFAPRELADKEYYKEIKEFLKAKK
ncbi:alpha/beta hydrolase family protein [Clostridium aquiflavi]|uniref:Alpha/beta hydrolase n=1 Tax=Clostridium aquiflavi TaxID=3073603 RepID=A0ABU1EJ08_9CLOT|nr:CocE/NonD family hydrolase [Clostridium sp. 5N-1]MDR5588047.1 alpha/beta hydrolase [Clostridium sp. 5N-1]